MSHIEKIFRDEYNNQVKQLILLSVRDVIYSISKEKQDKNDSWGSKKIPINTPDHNQIA